MDPAATPAGVGERLAELSGASWTLAAVAAGVEAGLAAHLDEPRDGPALAQRTGLTPSLAEALGGALVAAGLARRAEGGFVAGEGLAAMASGAGHELFRAELRTGRLHSAALVEAAVGGTLRAGWHHSDERVLQAQGEMSAGAVAMLENALFPRLDGLVERLDSGNGAFLDVGMGVGAVTIGILRHHPHLRAVGLEPLDAARALAQRDVAAAGMAHRVEVRNGLVQDLDDEEAFDLVWLPGNFLPAEVLPSALAAVYRALRPGGWLLNACLGGGDDSPRAAARGCARSCGAATARTRSASPACWATPASSR